jgi:hypothetical protein
LIADEALTLDVLPRPRSRWDAIYRFAHSFDPVGYHGSLGNAQLAASATERRWEAGGLGHAGPSQLRTALSFRARLPGFTSPSDEREFPYEWELVELLRRLVATGAAGRAPEEESFVAGYDLDARFPERRELRPGLLVAERDGLAWLVELLHEEAAGWERLGIAQRPISVTRFATELERDEHVRMHHPGVLPREEDESPPAEIADVFELFAALNSPSVVVRAPDGFEITTVDEWLEHAPPKSREKHWKDGRSAKELARAWTGESMPEDVLGLLRGRPEFEGFQPELALAEHRTRFDRFGGEARNHDLVLIGTARDERLVVGVEAKADEEFGSHCVGPYVERQRRTKPDSQVPQRADLLCRALFGRPLTTDGGADPQLSALRYQLLTALAGTAMEALIQQASRALLLVHEFVADWATTPTRLDANRRALLDFVAALGGVDASVMPADGADSWIIGPIGLPGGDFVPSGLPMYVAKLRTELT